MIRSSANLQGASDRQLMPAWFKAEKLGILRQPFLIALSVMIWLLIADLLIATGALHHLVSLKPSTMRAQSLEQQLFALKRSDFQDIIIGDPLFIEKARAALEGGPEEMFFLTLPGFHLADVATVAKAIRRRLTFERLVLQASPHFWSDLWMRQPALTIDLWLGYGETRWPQLKRAGLVFEVLAERLETIGKDDRERWTRPPTLRGISFVETPRKTSRMQKSLEGLKPDGLQAVYWIADIDHLAADIGPALQQPFDDRFAKSGFEPSLGHLLPGFAALQR